MDNINGKIHFLGDDPRKKLTFEEYYSDYYPRVYRYILKRIQNPEQAEDMAMEVFAKCFDKFGEFDDTRASFGTWVYTITKNKLKNYYRDKKTFENIDDCTECISGFEDEIIAAEYVKEVRDHLADALESLNDVQRKVVILKYFKEKSAPEIAEIMGMSAVNVRVTLSRGIARMKEYFTKNGIEL